MAALRITQLKPRKSLSRKCTPQPLRQALQILFADADENLWLVGGTALAGYYAQHRRSDDLDLFAGSALAFKAATLAVKALKKHGAKLSNESSSPYYYHTDVSFLNHAFTIDVVLDENLHRIGRAVKTQDKVWVADLATLLAMKIATLVSRCSEKDLFDLDWLLQHAPDLAVPDLIAAGAQIDSGLNPETLLISLKGATLRPEACGFLPPDSPLNPQKAYQKIQVLRQKLIRSILEYEKSLMPDEGLRSLSQAVQDFKKLRR